MVRFAYAGEETGAKRRVKSTIEVKVVALVKPSGGSQVMCQSASIRQIVKRQDNKRLYQYLRVHKGKRLRPLYVREERHDL